MTKLLLITSGVLLAIFSNKLSAECIDRKSVLVEVDGQDIIYINKKKSNNKNELDDFYLNCAKRVIVILDPKSTIGRVSDIAFYSAKSGVRLNSNNLFIFISSKDRRAMTFMPTMRTIYFSDDADVLEKIISHPPLTDEILSAPR